MTTQLPKDHQPALRVTAMPNYANPGGDIFGGWMMSQMDLAGAIVAVPRAKGQVATVAVKELRFIKPIYVFDLVSFYAHVVKVGNTSITTEIEAYAQRLRDKIEIVKVAEATIVYVAVSEPGVKRQIPSAS